MAKVEVIKSKNAGTPNYIWMGIIILAIVVGVGIGIYNNLDSFHKDSSNKTDDKNDNIKSKETIYRISVDDFDYFKENVISFSESYTAKMNGESLSATVSFMLYNNDRQKDQCYYSSQAKFNTGSSTTIQGNCTYNVNNGVLTVDGTFDKLVIPSSYENQMGMTSTKTKEDAHLECQVNSKGKSITCGDITYYNYTYTEINKRRSDYFLIDKKNIIYDEYGVGIVNDEYNLNLDDYKIEDVTSMPY